MYGGMHLRFRVLLFLLWIANTDIFWSEKCSISDLCGWSFCIDLLLSLLYIKRNPSPSQSSALIRSLRLPQKRNSVFRLNGSRSNWKLFWFRHNRKFHKSSFRTLSCFNISFTDTTESVIVVSLCDSILAAPCFNLHACRTWFAFMDLSGPLLKSDLWSN
mgnify:CR=1 FL=1